MNEKNDTPEKLLTSGSFFDLQRFADDEDEFDLPINFSTQTATVGKDYLAYVNGSSETNKYLRTIKPKWVLIGGQRGLGLNISADEIDATHKTSGDWKSILPGLKTWSLDLDSLLMRNEEGYAIIEEAFEERMEVNIKIEYAINPNDPDEKPKIRVGWGFVTDDSLTANHSGEASVKRKISGNGPLSRRMPEEPYERHLKQLYTRQDYDMITEKAATVK